MTPRSRLIVALDLPRVEDAENMVARLGDSVEFYKIGYQLIPVGGLDLAARLSVQGKKIFLDFKFHDIGATVERGTASVAKAGADFLTVHADPDVLAGAVQGRAGDRRLKILAITVLTSIDQAALARIGIETPIGELVLKRAEFAAKAGADGVVASAREAQAIRARFGRDLVIVTPGVRPKGAGADDQKRIATPGDAIAAGADYLVIGRPILAALDPRAAAEAIAMEIGGG